ncbi:MAG: hypothetical protein K2Q10_02580, partial [Rhodospirillales bacterium]|nr:hypothetical protein [Rhodospirillales bacterium]
MPSRPRRPSSALEEDDEDSLMTRLSRWLLPVGLAAVTMVAGGYLLFSTGGDSASQASKAGSRI